MRSLGDSERDIITDADRSQVIRERKGSREDTFGMVLPGSLRNICHREEREGAARAIACFNRARGR